MWIVEKELLFIPQIYNKLLTVFNTCRMDRAIALYFEDQRIPIISFDIGSYDETLNLQIRNLERQQAGVGSNFEDFFYQNIINNFNIFNNNT
jgi:hypothetical protein